MHRLKEFVQRNAAVFEHGANLDRELLAALAALVEAVADALLRVRLDLGNALGATAMRAHRAIRPKNAF